jgi:hypothetical protein
MSTGVMRMQSESYIARRNIIELKVMKWSKIVIA